MWFEQITGFEDVSPENVRNNLAIEGNTFISHANGERLAFGELEIPSLAQLRQKCRGLEDYQEQTRVSEIIADVKELHCRSENAYALFQAASQFNLLEMVGPEITPEKGIDRYEWDNTQGPACAIACGAGTIYRNYFVQLGDQIGQTAHKQIDCLNLIGVELENDKLHLWNMQNGYALFTQKGLTHINEKIAVLSHTEREKLKGKLRTGIQWNTEVTLSKTRHMVSQIYCSALPVAYGSCESKYWEPFARLILEATYEATLYAGLINLENNNSNKVYMTLVGGGAFGNKESWILESLQKAIMKFRRVPLDIHIVSYGRSNPNLLKCIETLNNG